MNSSTFMAIKAFSEGHAQFIQEMEKLRDNLKSKVTEGATESEKDSIEKFLERTRNLKSGFSMKTEDGFLIRVTVEKV